MVEGEVVWADAAFIKVRDAENNQETLVPKVQIMRIETLNGTELSSREEVLCDPWAGKKPDLAD